MTGDYTPSVNLRRLLWATAFRGVFDAKEAIARLSDTCPQCLEEKFVEFPDDLLLIDPRDLLAPSDLVELGTKHLEGVKRAFEELGTEAVAVYLPFHLHNTRWGIYIFFEALLGLAAFISLRSGAPFSDALVYSLNVVLEHETFHFYTEYVATIVESVTGNPVYIPYRDEHKPYRKDEEALANALAITVRPTGMRASRMKMAIMELFDRSPPGYRDYRHYLVGGSFNYSRNMDFWSRAFVRRPGVYLPTKRDLGLGRWNLPRYFVSTRKSSPDSTIMLHMLTANIRTIDILKKIPKILGKRGIVANVVRGGRHPFKIEIPGRGSIPVPYHDKEAGVPGIKILKEVSRLTGIDFRELANEVLLDP